MEPVPSCRGVISDRHCPAELAAFDDLRAGTAGIRRNGCRVSDESDVRHIEGKLVEAETAESAWFATMRPVRES